MNIPYELISDADHKIAMLYGTYGPKNFMGKEYLGIHRSTFLIGKNGRIIKVFHRVKPLGHSEQVMKEFGDIC
jgi:peroxiredoxin Q/BCP